MSTELWKDLFLRLTVKKFQMLCHAQSDFDILFIKLTAETEDCISKTLSTHYVSGDIYIFGYFIENFLSSFLTSSMVICTLMP